MPLPSPLLRSLALTSVTQSDFPAARRFGMELQQRGEGQADDVLSVEGAYVHGIAAFWQGELVAARGHFETAINRYQPALRPAHIFQYGLDPKVICLSRLGNTLWFLGEPGAAVRVRNEALALAEAIGHPFSQSTALVFAAMLSVEMRDLEGGRDFAEALLGELGKGTKPVQVHADAFAGYLDVVDGQVEKGMARIQRAVDETREAEHAPGIHACMLRLLLAACAASGNHGARLAAAERMLALSAVHLWEAEARRQRVECLGALGAPPAVVEAEFAGALQVAQRQQARLLELRAAISLLQFRQQSGDNAALRDAQDALAALLSAMPAALDTPEATEARLLLS